MGEEANGGKSMKNFRNVVTVEARRFPVLAVKQDNHEPYSLYIVLTKEQLRAAQIVGQSSKELIYRICERQGYKVLEIYKAEKKTIPVDLDRLWDGVADG